MELISVISYLVVCALTYIVLVKVWEYKAEKILSRLRSNLEYMRERVYSNGDRTFVSYATDEYNDAVEMFEKRKYRKIIKRWGYIK